MTHLFIEKDQHAPSILLLHGTGGNEHSLVELATAIAPNSSLLGIRGKVSEGGANRYFRRFAEGQFDLVDLEKQTDNLLEEVKELAETYQLDLSQMIILGYSNGANIGAHLMLEREAGFSRGLLFHPMSLGKHDHHFSLSESKVWLSYGELDPIVPAETFEELVQVFEERKSSVTAYRAPMSHGLTREELASAKQWLEELS